MNDFDNEDIDLPKPKTTLSYLKVEDVPEIPSSISHFDFHKLIPTGFEDQITAFLEGETIVLRCLKPENPDYTDVNIRPALFNSQVAKTVVPKFVFEKSTISNKPLDYFKGDKNLVLNINQVIYLLIAHRLTYFKSFNQQFVFLLQQDINHLSAYIEYTAPETFNARAKANNTYVIIPASAHQKTYPYGNFFVSCRPSEEDWITVMRDIGKYVQPSSDSAMHKRGKIVLSDKPIYRSVGYLPNPDGSFYSIFECKQNLPARLKTHYLGDAKRVLNYDTSVFQQDCIVSTNAEGSLELSAKDHTYKKAVMVFAPIEKDTKRFIAGEAEVSSNIADTLVVNTDSVNVSFVSKQGVKVKHEIGKTINVLAKQEVILGYDDELEPVTLPQGVLSYTITKINQSTTGGLSKLYFEAVMKAGNARITTTTGGKFVSKVMTNLGKICVPKRHNTNKGLKFAPTVTQYLKGVEESKLANYQRLDVDQFTEHNIDIIYPDVIVGMNAVKANTSEQCNTIVLAQATLAVELGYYKPSEKFGFEGLLNSFDLEEINRAAKSLPEFFYLDRYGKRQKVLIGMSYLNFTELGSVYTRFKPQSFAFTSGKNIHQNMPELSKHIYDNYLEQDKVEIAKELFKVLNDPKGRLRIDDKIPRYTPKVIRNKKLFGENDLILSKALNTNKQDSKLLDEDWNKGFYIDLTAYDKGPLIRIPSAKTLKCFVGNLPDGTYSFHGLIVNISKMILNIIGNARNNYQMSIGFLYNKANIGKRIKYSEGRLSSYDLYMNTIQGALYSNEDSAMMIIQSLIKPKIKGVGMKQVVEPLLPDDVLVITDNRKYNRILKEANSDGTLEIDFNELKDLLNEDYDDEVDNLINLAINDTTSKDDIEAILHNVPLTLAIRDPSLWELQLWRPRVWSRAHFALYLSRCSQPLDLDEYLSPHHNRDIVLVSSYGALCSKSDCDGDRLPIFCLNAEGQRLLKDFKLNNVLKEEQDWVNTYIEKEFNSTKKLHIDNPEKHVYKLFKVSNVFDPKGDNRNYPQYLFNAQLAKGNIGPATIDMWALYMVFECYMAYCEQNDFNHYSKEGKFLGNITQVLTQADKKLLSFKQTELVQGNVIEAVKHMEGGSSAFKKYFLDGMTETNNIDIVRKELTQSYEEGGYGMKVGDANRMLYIVKWAKDSQLLKGVKNFITKYNKGKLPAKPEALDLWEDFIQANTYFGGLIQPIFDIKKTIERKNIEAVANAQQFALQRKEEEASIFDSL